MADITVRQLEYFLAVVDHGSISASARHLHISQAAVSVAIQQLERQLNADLLSRAPARRALPTPAGQALLPHARRVVAALADAAESVQDDRTELRGTLRVISTVNVSPHVLPPMLEHFKRQFPDVMVRISEASPADIHESIRTGQADLGLGYQRQSSSDFKETLVDDVRQHVMIPAGHRLAARASVHLKELEEDPFIMVDIPPSVERITQLMLDLGVSPRLAWKSQNFETVRSLVAHGLGWSFVNVIPASTTTYNGQEVAYVPIADDIPANPIVAMTLPNAHHVARVRAALKFFTERRALLRG
ncbi:LysR family transcriptional regulator [Micrococcus sp. IITD107]|uniref:LysR family transcriptional regulator n=1 Tax=Micrococcus sp. IITD107 TaxID=3342790 RepID=UPI0035B7E820